jgi:Ca2+-binding RTX toxin-like protein
MVRRRIRARYVAPAMLASLTLAALGGASCSSGPTAESVDASASSRPSTAPSRSTDGEPTASTAPEPTATRTGRPASKKGEAGFDQLPTCATRRRATILGTDGDDRIVGTRADDVIVSFGGNDHISHLRGVDEVCTGAGNDVVIDVAGRQVAVELGSGRDLLRAVKNVGEVSAGAGDDRVVLPIDAIAVGLGTGDDTLTVVPAGAPHFPYGIPYNSPCVDYRAALRPMRVNLLRGWAQGQGRDRLANIHCVRGSRFDDIVTGTRYGDDIDVGGGSDTVRSLDGNDTVYDNSYPGAADIFRLGGGNDSVMSGGGSDRVYGEAGDDFVEAGAGADYLEGGDGDDELDAAYRCDGGNSGGAGMSDQLPNEVFGGPGNDRLRGDLGNDRLSGGAGFDTADGGHEDRRVDWYESVEKTAFCQSPF